MTNFLNRALSYLPSGSTLYNSIKSALDAVMPDYATLRSLYDQARAAMRQNKQDAYQRKLERMRIKYGDPTYQAPRVQGPQYNGPLPQDPPY
ncbi:hypothetical protein M8J77_007903 [Diaphorina citri]|nr:hypothetical protein M8J77_007903 [Diaphorina citri]